MNGKRYDRNRTVRELRTLVILLLLLIFTLIIVICAIRSKPAEEPMPQMMKPTLCAEPKQLLYTVPETETTGGGTEAPEAEAEEPTKAAPPEAPVAYIREDIPLGIVEQKLLHEAAKEFEIPYTLALAVVEKETHYQNLIGDGGDSFGYMQIQPRWWREKMDKLCVTELMDPQGNFRVGCSILADALNDYDVAQDAIASYNGSGPKAEAYAAVVVEIWDRLEAAGEH